MAGMATVSIPQDLPLGVVGGGWTAADLELLPDDGRRYEIIDGVLIVSPAPTPYHQRSSAALYRLFFESCPRGYEVFFAPLGWNVSDTTVFEPDLMVVRRSDVTPQRLVGTPLLAVEVASPSTAQADRMRKFGEYARAGLGQYWIVDPGSGGSVPSIEVYDLVAGGYDDVPGETSVGYNLQIRAVGDEQVSVAGPVPVSVIPADLIA